MKEIKVLIYGSRGWIGQKICHLLRDQNIECVEGKVRVDNTDQLRKEIVNTSPTHVVCSIGRTHGPGFGTIDYLEQPGKLVENVRDNLYSPLSLAFVCKEYDIHLTYLGTGCIFEYDKDHPYADEKTGFTEDSVPNFFGSSYSTVKGFTDQLTQFFDNVLNVRIRMPISSEHNPRNFIYKITHYEKICSIPNSMTVLEDILPLMINMLKNEQVGTINLTNPGLITHDEILQMYKEIVDPEFTWKNFTMEEQEKILAAGRSNNCLCTSKLEFYYPRVTPIKEAVRKTMMNYKKD